MIYLASPYTRGSAESRLARFHAVTLVAARLIEQNNIVYSPITMTHPIDIVMAHGETLGSEFWVTFDEAFMAVCSQILVLKLPGWDKSSGVRREIEYFRGRGLEPNYLEPADFEILSTNPVFAAAFVSV